MKERPILFNTAMVQAILEGRKTQTRRILQCDHPVVTGFIPNGEHGYWKGTAKSDAVIQQYITTFPFTIKCPFGIVGDRLWVRETFRLYDSDECPHADFPCGCPRNGTPLFKASHDCGDGEKWTPSIHMPRSASRILLEITKIRVERLNDISSEDAKAEGFDYSSHQSAIEMGYAIGARTNFRHEWEEIYGQNAWNKNPWVWVIEFQVIEGGE
ncbi:hypothetical protein [Acinetobacter sp. MD2(2019)]|uniref:hypothetical protein n=1 Tax=Acinetobacter sp. MD2(2019) TaxID=2605273 RepID=UPI002D1E97A4|nr:hypothetical protein [Acinetobacter sp. MD2(2019)]MEB3753812.1 hypothetical protein [Acinetobacter sp. MD2(2019)]